MAAAMKKSMLLFLFLVIALHTKVAKSQAQGNDCPKALGNLNLCAASVVPGNDQNPSSECCNALQAVSHDCVCQTIRIASRLPAQCNLPAINCASN